MEVLCLYVITVASLLYICKNVYSAIKEDDEDYPEVKIKNKRRR